MGPVYAADNTVTGSLTAYQTFESIGIRAGYSGDDDRDMTAVVEYRESGGTWQIAHEPLIDRSGGGFSSQARTSLFYLKRDTSYDIRITFSDPDSVSGTNPVTTTVTTWSHDQPTYGSCNQVVSSDSQLSSALSACDSVGGTITLRDGNYGGRTISESGRSGGYIHIVAENSRQAVFTGQVTLSGDYLHLDGLKFTASNPALRTSGSATYNIIDDCEFSGNEANIQISGTVTGLLIENSYFHGICSPGGGSGTRPDYGSCTSSGPDNAINLNGPSEPLRAVFRNNEFTQCRDAFGMYTGSSYDETDIYGNEAYDFADDFVEYDDNAINVRSFGNLIYGKGYSAVSSAGTKSGPAFFFNNIIDLDVWRSIYAVKLGSSSSVPRGPVYFYYNTFWVVDQVDTRVAQDVGGSGSENLVWKNNVISGTGYFFQVGGCGYSMDYNLYETTNQPNNKWQWGWRAQCGGGVNLYSSLSSFTTATGHDSNSQNTNAGFKSVSSRDFTASSENSNIVDAGITIDGITKDYAGNPRVQGSAPDIGAFEYSSSPPLQDCSQLGGSCCSGQEACQGGSLQDAPDCPGMCCIGGSCQVSPPEMIIDNDDPEFSTEGPGEWKPTGNPNPYGSDSLYNTVNDGSTASWTPDIPQPGQYEVYAWWTSVDGRVNDAKYLITHSQGTDQVEVNQKLNGGQWNLLGTYPFQSGTSGYVSLIDTSTDPNYNPPTTSDSVCADAIRLVYSGQAYHPADEDWDCEISLTELILFIDKWYEDSASYTLEQIMQAIAFYYSGNAC
jgi:hypothetical protein